MYRNYRTQQVTQDQVDAYRDATRAAFAGQPFEIESNGHGLRAECMLCNNSATLNPEMWMREHQCAPERIAEIVEMIKDAVDMSCWCESSDQECASPDCKNRA